MALNNKNRTMTLESRIARLEKLANPRKVRNESFGNRLQVGDRVLDSDGYEAIVVDIGWFDDMLKKWGSELCDDNREFMDEIEDYYVNPSQIDDAVVIRYIDTSDLTGGDCAICIDADNALEKITESKRVRRCSVKNEFLLNSSEQAAFYKSEILPQLKDFKDYFQNIQSGISAVVKMLGKGQTGDDLNDAVADVKEDIRYLKDSLDKIEESINDMIKQ